MAIYAFFLLSRDDLRHSGICLWKQFYFAEIKWPLPNGRSYLFLWVRESQGNPVTDKVKSCHFSIKAEIFMGIWSGGYFCTWLGVGKWPQKHSVLVSAHECSECVFCFSGHVTVFTLVIRTYTVFVSPCVGFLTNGKRGNAKDRVVVEWMSAGLLEWEQEEQITEALPQQPGTSLLACKESWTGT